MFDGMHALPKLFPARDRLGLPRALYVCKQAVVHCLLHGNFFLKKNMTDWEFQALKTNAQGLQHGRFSPISTRLTKGTHGSVIVCTDAQSHARIALKKIEPLEKNGFEAHAMREIAAYKRVCRHPNILQLKSVFREAGATYLVLQAVEHTLKDVIRDLDGSAKMMYKRQIASGIAWCHEKGIMHRDIKPANMLVQDRVLKICDFGLARLISSKGRKKHSLCAVTLWYRALEILLGDQYYTESVDVWAMACVFYEIDCNGAHLFPGDSDVDQIMKIYHTLGNPNEETFPGVSMLPYFDAAIRFTITKKRRRQLDEFYVKMMSYDMSKRPTAAEVLAEMCAQEFLSDSCT